MSFKSNEREVASQLKDDFKEFEGRCMGILLFGSYADEEPTKRSDIDVCIVKPMPSSWSCEPTDSAVILSYDSIACA